MASAFVGRSEELGRLDEVGPGSLVTLWGPGGVGKTRLATEHAARERARGRVVAWADLAIATTRREAVAAIAAALGVAPASSDGRGDRDEVSLGIAHAADAQGALLVLDNLEQLDDGAREEIAKIAAAVRNEARGARSAQRAENIGGVGGGAPDDEAGAKGEGATLLATSRELIGAADEISIAITPLGEDDALALFAALAGAPTGGESEAVTRSIVQRLDALPLAIELAAARVPLLGATELLARLDRKLDVLGTARADRPARHATLRAAISWSWDLLDDGERDALMACATFEAPFDAALAEAVIGGAEADALDRLERLRGRALVHAATDARGRARLRLLESVRDFAREASAAAGDDAAARLTRHAEAVLARSEPLAEAARCGRDTLADLEALRSDLVAALRRSGGVEKARAALALAALLAISGPPIAALDCIDEGMTVPEGPMHTRLIIAKGDALRALGRLAEARDVLASGITLADEGLLGAEARRIRGSVLRSLGQVDEALAHKEAALATYRAIGDRAREGICLGEIGAVHQSEGRLALAKGFHAEAIAIHTATGSRRAEGVERSYLAVATHRAGDPAASIALHEEALAIHREVGHRRLEGAELLHLGFVHHELESIAAARTAFADARRMLAAAGARGLEAIALVFAARLEVDAGDTTAALLKLAEASQLAPPSWPRIAATRHLIDGHLAMATGAADRARASYEAALSTSRDLEVGFEALTPAYLAVAIARSGAAPSTDVETHLAAARAAVATLENPHLRVALEVLAATASGRAPPEVPTAAMRRSSEVRRALGMSGAERSLAIEDNGKRVVLPDGRAVDLSKRKNVRLVLLALARARHDAPGTIVSPDTLLEAGWPGERMRADAATKRLHTAIWTLRSLGLEALLLTEGEGYLLDPRTPLLFKEA